MHQKLDTKTFLMIMIPISVLEVCNSHISWEGEEELGDKKKRGQKGTPRHNYYP